MLTSQPLVSVIIPAYNHEKYVQETLNSIIEQTYSNIELLIVDDGSTDSTVQKIDELLPMCEQRFVRVFFECQQNQGINRTLARMISIAKGEYIYFIASDDIASPIAVQTEVEFLADNQDYVLAVGDNSIIDSSSNICYWDVNRNIVNESKLAKYKTFADFLQVINHIDFTKNFGKYEYLYLGNHVPNGYTIKKSALDDFVDIIQNEQNILEDWSIMLHLSKKGKLKFFNKVLFFYRWHANNTIKNTSKVRVMFYNTVLLEEKLLIDYITKNPKSKLKGICDRGVLIKSFKIPYLFEFSVYKKHFQKLKEIKVLGKVVYSRIKNTNYTISEGEN